MNKINIVTFFILLSGIAFGQKLTVISKQKSIADSLVHIDSLVNSIRLENTLQKINIDSISVLDLCRR